MGKTISEAEYRKHVAMAGAGGNFFTFRECYLNIMSRDAALVIQKMMNKYGYLLKKGKLRSDEWFRFTVEQLERSLRMKRDCQIRILSELQGLDGKGNKDETRAFIGVRRNGVPPRRYVWIDFLKLNRALEQGPNNGNSRYLQKQGENPNQREFPTNGNSRLLDNGKPRSSSKVIKEGKQKGGRPTARPSPPPSKLSEQASQAANQPHLAAAKKLRQALRSHGHQVLGSDQSNASNLRLLAEQDGQDYEAVLDWYCRHCSAADLEDLGLPEIASGKQFRTHWNWISRVHRKHCRAAVSGRPLRPEDDPDFLGMAPPGFDTPEYRAEQAAEMDRLAEERQRENKRTGRVVRIVRVDEGGRP